MKQKMKRFFALLLTFVMIVGMLPTSVFATDEGNADGSVIPTETTSPCGPAGEEVHTPAEDDGNCTTDILCTVCGGVATAGQTEHVWAETYTTSAEGHYKTCVTTGCQQNSGLEAHTSGGSATEQAPETCTVCSYEIAPALAHTHNYQIVADATTEAECLSHGETTYKCSGCGDSYVTYTAAKSGVTWDFSQNSASSTDATVTMSMSSYASGNAYTEVPVADGALTVASRSTIQMSKATTLKADQDWVFEIVAKGDGTTAIGAVANSNYTISSSKYIYIDATGDLTISNKYSYTGDNGTTVSDKYCYFRVSNDDYNASALAKSDFKVTEYHNYQLRHSADGVYSFWLDGEKVGDLSLTENGVSRTGNYTEYTGARDDLNVDLEIDYIGGGDSNSGRTSVGLLGSVKYYGLYTGHTPEADDGNCATAVECSVCEAVVTEGGAHTPAEDDGDCTTDVACSVCGNVATKGAASHTPAADDGDCTTDVSCANCTKVATAGKSEHTWAETYSANEQGHYKSCANADCQQTTEIESHISGGAATTETPEVCTVCEYVITPIQTHTHNYQVVADATKAAACLSRGETTYKCTECTDSYVEYSVAKSGYTWDFSQNSASSTDGAKTLAIYKTADSTVHSTVPVQDGALTAEVRLVMNGIKGVVLGADQDWTIDVIAKAKDAAEAIGAVAVHGSYSVGSSKTIFVYIDENGDLMIGNKYAFTGDDGTASQNTFTYYKVSNEAYNNSVLASDSFDTTEYHNYQLRHSAEGVYSYWLDGTKIGDLTLTEDGNSRTGNYVEYTGARTDLDTDLKISYIGCGDSASGYTNLGLLGSLKYYGLYTGHTAAADDGDCTTAIACTACGEVVTEGAASHTPAADDGDCTTDILCTVCNTVTTKGAASHTPAEDDGDCTTAILCSVCKSVATEGAASHTPEEDDGNCTTDILCSVCKTVTTEGAASHTPEEDDGDCTTDIVCSVCKTVTTEGQTEHKWSEKYSHTAEGHYKTCENADCKQASATETHVSGGAATEETAETCTVCGYEIAPALGHTHGVTVTTHTGTDATCIAAGVKTYYECSCGRFFEEEACTTEIPDLESWKVIAIDPAAHSYGEWNAEVPATCEADGTKGYKVCALCEKNFDAEGNEIEDLTIKSEGHDYVAGATVEATCLSHGETTYKCSVCGDSYVGYTAAKSGVAWNFENNSVSSTDGTVTMSMESLATGNTYTEVPVVNGVLAADSRSTIKLAPVTTLKADEEWVFEIVAKGTGSDAIGAVASTHYAIASAKYIYIDANGDLSISNKYSYTGDNGTAVSGKYCYYKVSDADYNASALASDSFNVTDYHTYQLHHSADGVYTFWLDGVKVGNLALTENGTDRTKTSYVEYTGTRDDLNVDLGIDYIGGGDSTSNRTSVGLHGSVKYYGLYTGHTAGEDDGDCTTAVACTVCGDVAVEGAASHTPAADDGDCTTDILCTVCNTVTTKGAASHTPAEDDGDCTTDILCSVCKTVTTEGAASHTPEEDDGDCTTDILCSVCKTVTTEGAASHTPEEDDGDCTTAILCSVCKSVITEGQTEHKWSEKYSHTAEGHYKTCENADCNQTSATETHVSGGAATEETAETCTVCGYEIAPALGHTHGVTVTTHTGTDATCSAAGVKTYYECSCGRFFEEEACTTEITDVESWKVIAIDPAAHSFGEWNAKVPATCEADGTKGYKACSICEKNFDVEGNEIEDLTIKSEGHDYVAGATVEATCLSHGETAYKCSVCDDSYVENNVAKSGYTWDFSQNSASSTDGAKTLKIYKTADSAVHSTVPVHDGALTAEVRLVMNGINGVVLGADQAWTIEAVIKGVEGEAIGSIAVNGSYSVGNSKTVFVYIDENGDLMIGNKQAFTGDDGTASKNTFTYYKVSNEAYNNSVLASDSFDIAEYHNYQLRHSADGVYSYWLDGTKIGDLTLTEDGNSRTGSYVEYTGVRTDLDMDLKISYIGCGDSGSGYTNLGLLGSMKYYGLYTGHTAGEDDGDCTTDVACTVCNGVAVEGAKSHTPAEDDGDCTTAILCSVCNTVTTEAAASHTPAEDDGDCTTDILCSVCNTVTTKGAASHTPDEDDGDCTTDILCSVCKSVTTEGAASHTPEEDDGDCTTDIVCSVCKTVTTEGQTEHKWSEKYSHTAEGHYKTCENADCEQISATEAHVSGGAATAEQDEVCTVCEYVITPALGHTHGVEVTTHTGTDATCVAAGVKTYYECSCGRFFEEEACTTEISDLESWKVIAIDPAAHSFGEWKEEVPATCEADGTKGYKACQLCEKNFDAEGKEIEDLTIKSEGHDYVAGTTVEATCLSHGEATYKCSVCGDSYATYVPAESGITWDFSQNSTKATDGESTLTLTSYAKNTYTEVPIADGALTSTARVAMTLPGTTLKADQDWVIEIVAKGVEGQAIGAIAAAGSYSVSKATYVHIDETGDLMIGKKMSYVGDNDTEVTDKYSYYKVSNADYNASALASDSFDFTAYHNYQLRHSADGVYSFWLDGTKVGDLALTENGVSRTKTSYVEYTGARTDLDVDLKISYFGVGASSDYTNFGLLGSVKYYGLYTGHTAAADDGDCTKGIRCSVCSELLSEGADSHTPAKDDGDCTTDILCTLCGSVATKGNAEHSYTQNLVSDVLATPATCTEAATYYIRCDNCNVAHTETTQTVGEANGHNWDEGVVTKPATETEAGIRTLTCTVDGCGATSEVEIPKLESVVEMHYDDRMMITELGQAGQPVISEQEVTSYKVGTTTPDDAVLVYDSGKLIAVGTGTAKVTWGEGDTAVSYRIAVSAAPISMFMITGHSLGAGSRGVVEESIVCEAGQVYSTNEVPNDFKLCVGDSSGNVTGTVDLTGMGLGYGSAIRPETIDAMTDLGDGVVGSDSALAYQWAKMTGEKVWVLNSSIGSSNLNSWQAGGINYKHAVALFKAALTIMNNEVTAGHYAVNHMGVVNFSTANGDQTWTKERYTEAFNSMWNGFRSELAIYDFNGDGTKDTVDCIGVLPTWKVCSTNDWDNMTAEPLAFYNVTPDKPFNGKIINYVMSAFDTTGVIIASDGARKWTTDKDVQAYFTANPIKNLYGILQNGNYHENPTTVRGINYDGIHFNQLGYNVQGIESAKSMYKYWYGTSEQTTVKLLQSDGVTDVPATVTITEGKNYIMVPAVFPTSSKVTYEITGDDVITYDGGYVTATGVGTAQLTIKDMNGKKLRTVTVNTEKRSEDFYEDISWYVWDFAGDAISTAGNNTITSNSGTMTISGGKADFEAALATMGTGVELDKTNDWAVEFTLKAKTDSSGAVLDPGSLVASSNLSASAVSVYLNNEGSMSLMRRGDIGSYTAKYWHFAVAPATLRENLPEDFDMTQTHTYQLRCTGGVFSYWLDGEKIGDLTTTYNDNATYTGEYMDFNSFTVKYLGNGTSSNAAKYGVNAVVEQIRIFADASTLSFDVGLDAAKVMDDVQVYPGDTVVLTRPDTGEYCATFIGWNTAADLSGTVYKLGATYTVSGMVPTTLYAQWEDAQSGGVHNWGENPVKEAIKVPSDCQNAAVYYTSCSECGATSAGTENEKTFSYGSVGGHSFVTEKAEDEYLKEAANCDHADIYYKSCAACGLSSKGQSGEATFTSGSEKHSYTAKVTTEGACTAHGETTHTCSLCGDSYVTYDNALSGYTWDFSANGVNSLAGSNKLTLTTYAANTYTEIPVVNGELYAEDRVAMKLSKSVAMNADSDWVIEVIAKGDGTNDIGAIAAAGSYSVSKATYVYIDKTGDLMIGKKISYTGDNGAEMDGVYAYYKVSNADYEKSALASNDFKITEYHNYQLRHSAEGVYSFWLDGVKVGDLALTENGTDRTKTSYVEYTGAREDLNVDLKISYFGIGASSTYTNMGLMGVVKLYGLYSGHSYSLACDTTCDNDGCNHVRDVEHTYEDDGDCTTAVLCSVCNEEVIAAKTAHTWSKTYGATTTGHYRSCTVCGTRETEADHTSGGAATNTAAEVCTVCDFVITPALGHTHGTEVTTHTGKEATCSATGSKTYYECSCTKVFEDAKCTTEIADLAAWVVIEIDAEGHSYTDKASETLASEANCAEPAYYYVACDYCDHVSEAKTIAVGKALGHDFTAEVAEDKYLKNKPDCDTVAVYYKSCAVCGESSKGTDSEATFETTEAHSYTTKVLSENSCLAHGQTTYTCSACGDSYVGYDAALSGTTWDFTQGTATATDGVNTLTVFKSFNDTYTEVPVVDGALKTDERLTMKLSNAISLKRTNDWVIEIIAKDHNKEGIRAFLSTYFAVSNATYLYIAENGDLSIAKKYSYTSDDGITIENKFCYYKVSNEDFENSALNEKSFDITQYHNYQLRCTDGVYSFWLDNVKVGDLALTENIATRSDDYAEYTGPRDDIGTLKLTYIGCGDGSNRAGLGLSGTVEYLGIYTGHSYSNACDTSCNTEGCGHTREITHKYTDDGDCTTPVGCSLCGELVIAAKPAHTWSTAYGYTTTQHYRVCEECGTEETYANHVSGGAATNDQAETCTVCSYVITAALSHEHGKSVTTHTGEEATCQETGTKTYYECSCTKLFEDAECTTEIADLKTWIVLEIVDHSFTAETAEVAYLKSAANYERGAIYYKSCEFCGLSSAGQTGEAQFVYGYPSDGYYNVLSKTQWDTAPGIKETQMVMNNEAGNRRQIVYFMEVDLDNEYATIMPSYKEMNPTLGHYGKALISEQAAWAENELGLNVVGAMNTYSTTYDSDYYKAHPELVCEPLGVLVMDGTVYANNETDGNGAMVPETCIVVNYDEKDGVKRPASIPKVQLRDTSTKLTGWEEQVIPSLWGWLIKDGVNLSNAVDHESVNPRSVVGIKADGTLVMLVNDGRQRPYSYGMSYYELGEMLLAMGCVNAINCDGGGSSVFLSQRPGEELKVVSSPSNGGERASINGMLVISTAPSDGEFVRASITTEYEYYTPKSTVQFTAKGVDLAGNAADIPSGATWKVTNGMGTINKNGKFVSNGTVGEVTAQLVYNSEVVGFATINIVNPDTVEFAQSAITIPNGKSAELNIVATYGIYDVKIKPEDFKFELSDSKVGTMDGFTLNATEDTSVTSGEITMTYVHSSNMTSTAQLILGQASKVLFDFENGLGTWKGHRGPHRNQAKFNVYAVDSTNGKVRNGNGAMAVLSDFSYSTTSGQNHFNITYTGEDLTIENAQAIGFWVYVPEELPYTSIMAYFYADDETSQTKTEVVHNEENTAKTGWQYVKVDISEFDSITLKNDVLFLRIVSAMSESSSGLTAYPGLNFTATWYIDDITVDYSVAVDDREAPVFEEPVYAGNGAEVDGLLIADNYPSFTVNVAENMTKSNATGLDGTTAKAYIDGNPVQCAYQNGTITVTSSVKLAEGPHELAISISDKAGNSETTSDRFTVAANAEIPTIRVEPHDATLDKLLMGSQYWVDIVASAVEKTQSATVKLNLNNHSTWQLDHMDVADGFKATWSMDNTNPSENIAIIQIERTGDSLAIGEGTLVSIPVRIWEWSEDGVPANNSTSEKYTPAERWAIGLVFKAVLSVKAEQGTLKLTDGTVVSFNSDKLVVDTENYINSYSRNNTAFFSAPKNSWHIHKVGTVENKAATCTEDGYTGRVFCIGCECGSTEEHDATNGCGAILTWGTTIEATGHNYKVSGDRIVCECGEALTETGVVECEGDLYYLIDGKMASGWQIYGEDTYYADPTTKKLVTGEQVISDQHYTFDENGKLTTPLTGIIEVNGKMYYYENGTLTYAGLVYLDGYYYYVNSSHKVVTGTYYVGKTNGLLPAGTYEFDSTGKMINPPEGAGKTGIFTEDGRMYYYKDGEKYYAGLIEIDGDYYYVNSSCRVVTGSYNITKTNGLMEPGTYEFDSTGKMIIGGKTGIFTEDGRMYYYKNGVKNYAGLIEIDGDYYYVNSSYRVVTGTYTITKTNGLMDPGTYVFDSTGKMVQSSGGDTELKNGIYNENGTLYYYKDGAKNYAGLIQIDGDYYYVNSSCKVVTGTYTIGKTNGLLPAGTYQFDTTTGKMLNPGGAEVKNGIYNENGTLYYYKDGAKNYAGLIQIDGDYYYVNSSCKVVTGTYYIGKTNGLLPAATYEFDTTTGKMLNPDGGVVKNGIYNENGTLYYYQNGAKYYAGLIQIDGDYYYVNSSCKVVTGTYYIGKTNDLLPAGTYEFDTATGKMLNPPA